MNCIDVKDILALHFPVDCFDKENIYKKYTIEEKPSTFKIVPIKETIHYKALQSGNFKKYEQYNTEVNNFRKEKYFLELANKINKEKDLKEIILSYRIDLEKFLILDGLHRLCIATHKKIIEKKIKNTKIFFSKKTIDFIKKELEKTTGGSQELKNGWYNRTKFGYHSFNIGNINILGQRIPIARLNVFRKIYNFENKKVIDLGCNNGGMLFHLTEIYEGLGLDFDERCIKCANNLKKVFKFSYNLKFLKKDLNKPINLEKKFDVAFLLSLGSWINNWAELYKEISKKSKVIFLETNNEEEGKKQLAFMHNLGFKIKLIIDKSLDDTTGNIKRKTYFLHR